MCSGHPKNHFSRVQPSGTFGLLLPMQLEPPKKWGCCFVGACDVGPWVGEQNPYGTTPLMGNHSPHLTYLPTYLRCTAGWPENC